MPLKRTCPKCGRDVPDQDDPGEERRAGAVAASGEAGRVHRELAAQEVPGEDVTAAPPSASSPSSRARPELQLLSTLGRWTKVQWRHPWLPRNLQ